MPIIDTKTGKVLVTDERLIRDLKKWLSGMTKKELSKMVDEEIRKNKLNKLKGEK